MDKRRLQYLAYTLQQDMELQVKYTSTSPVIQTPLPPPAPPPRLELLMERREREMEQCNMLLLLLLACLEYNLPLDVMRATLETAKLTNIGYVHKILLSFSIRISSICICVVGIFHKGKLLLVYCKY